MVIWWETETGRLYQVNRAYDLLTGWTNAGDVVTGDGARKAYTNQGDDGSNVFLRVQVERE